MILEMKKFGKILNSRSNAREAVLRARQIINGSQNIDKIILDFGEVKILTPSFADEFIKRTKKLYPQKEVLIQGIEENPVIKDTLETLNLL